jgi:hypothetical protein
MAAASQVAGDLTVLLKVNDTESVIMIPTFSHREKVSSLMQSTVVSSFCTSQASTFALVCVAAAL